MLSWLDGRIDCFERAMEFMFIEEMVMDDSGDEDEFAGDNDYLVVEKGT